MSAPLTLGTAGHIDHGKTALVAALTGTNTDRLPEERRRGVSIALGYAQLELPSGRLVSVVDVPGHERFVRTMVAGATGIDLFLMTVAADDGVMPQTHEHAAVLRGLGVDHGVVAITKADLADPATAAEEAAALLPGVDIVPVSVRTSSGLEELRAALDGLAATLPGRAGGDGDAEAARLHVDRVFSIRGAGTVVTGTLWTGAVARGDEVRILPGDRRARIRRVQVHDRPMERALAGQRVALNLAGLGRGEVARGDLVAGAETGVVPSYFVDAALDLPDGERRPGHGDRVQVHHGTREAPARLAELGGRFWQVRLELPLLCAAGDRLVVRRIAPPDTLAGGVVLDPHARRHGASRDGLARLARRERGEAEPQPEPAASAVSPPEPPPAPPRLTPAALALEERLRAAAHEPPPDSELPAGELAALRAAGRAVRVGRQHHFHPEALARARERVVALAEAQGEVTLAQVRDGLETSRKFAQALLEHLDAEKVTLRRGETRVLRRRAARSDGPTAPPLGEP